MEDVEILLDVEDVDRLVLIEVDCEVELVLVDNDVLVD